MKKLQHTALCLLAAALLQLPALAAAQAAPSVAADLQMAQDAQPFRRTADAFVASALAGDAARTQAMLSPALVARSGEAAIRRALDTQILPFFASGKAPARASPSPAPPTPPASRASPSTCGCRAPTRRRSARSPSTWSRSRAATPSPTSCPTAWSKDAIAEAEPPWNTA
jgi:hypothetical protein